jgi:hypothetical protein
MKNILLLLLLSATCYSQILDSDIYQLTFDDTTHYGKLFADTVSNPENMWQIGSPQKNILNEAFSPPNVIITDTINPYSINDTSIFKIIHRVNIGLALEQRMEVSGHFKVDSDSLKDFGLIEYSPDNGVTWLNMINNQSFDWGSEKPVLTGLSDWTYFGVSFDDLGYDLEIGDTVQFRFTFISDSIQENRGGLMFDDLFFFDFYEGVNSQIYTEFYSLGYPNPCDQWLNIEFENSLRNSVNLEIIDNSGKIVSKVSGGEPGNFRINISSFQSGSYFYRLVDHESNRVSHGKFIVK